LTTDSCSLAAARFLSSESAPALPPELDAVALLAFAATNGLLGLMHERAFAAGADRLPPAFVAGLRAGAHQQAARELLRRAELQCVIAALHEHGVRPLLMKGASLAYDVYPDPASRVHADVDMLIPDADVEPTRQCLADRGYTSEPEVAGRLVSYQFHRERTDAHGLRHLYDVHWKIANPQRFAAAVAFDELAADAVPLPLLGPQARGLGRAHALWLACVHRAAHHYDQESLVWLYDVHLLAATLDDDAWARVVALAGRTGVRRICLRALLLARDCLGTGIAPGVIAALEAAPADEPSTLFLRPGVRKLDVLLDDVRMLPGWRPRLALLKEHLFPGAAYMRRTYARGSSAPTAWLYLRRIAGGASKWIRG
jgi:hypothetical protein